MEYQFAEIEKKWQETWIREKTFEVGNEADRPKFYALIEFPYPSGEGLHMGHPRPYTALDIISRKRRMQGYSVLFPMGWDAFGLPTENYAMRNHIHPAIVTQERTARFKAQMQAIGFSFDWSREINTTDPNYYKWTQWIFLQMFKRGLAYKKEMAVNFCTSCKVVLANEEVVDGNCERCGSEVIRKEKSQWMLAITQYADRLIDDLDSVDYPERVKASQIHWIGRSYGFEVDFRTTQGDVLRVFTTRPDTLFGVTYMVIAPEHPALQLWKNCIENIEAVESYRQLAAKKSDFERTEIAKEKTGVQVQGVYAVNPVNNQKIPIYVSDYVLSSYGTGAIMAVPGHDTRDYEFAKKYGLPIVEVVSGGNIQEEAYTDCEQGIMVHSGMLDGLSVEEAKVKISDWLEKNEKGSRKTNYKLRDWVFARQRYWGEPIPMVHCDKCGYVPLPEEELPLVLPELENYEPTDDGQSPLSRLAHWVKTVCPQCGSPAKRETDTMPQWAGSSWYFLRYCDPKNDKALADRKVLEHWLPVDWYNGGMEHTTLHLLYSRFWYKFLYDIGVVPTKEPYAKRTSHGFILGEDNQKMSKTRGNVINPDDVIAEYGADTLRLYEMFIGDFEKTAPWSTASVRGCKRFLDRVWGLLDMPRTADGTKDMDRLTHRTIKKVSADIEHLKFNTAIAAMMTYTNELYASKCVTDSHLRIFLCLLNPFAPHITEEMWQQLGFSGQVSRQEWPVFEEAKCSEDVVEIVVQVNGKIKTRILVSVFAAEEDVLKQAMEESTLAEELKGKSIIKKIYVKSKLINIVAR